MFCKQCGSVVQENEKFCPACGTPVQQNAADVVSAVPTPAPAPAPAADSVPASGGYHYTMPTCRAWWKMLLLGLITLGIYPVIVQDKMVHELNVAAFRHDGKTTLSAAAIAPLIAITLSIYYFVYQHQYTNRLGNELRIRGISYSISAVHFWLLGVLFGWTLVCPLVLLHKVCKAHNLINADYNQKGM